MLQAVGLSGGNLPNVNFFSFQRQGTHPNAAALLRMTVVLKAVMTLAGSNESVLGKPNRVVVSVLQSSWKSTVLRTRYKNPPNNASRRPAQDRCGHDALRLAFTTVSKVSNALVDTE